MVLVALAVMTALQAKVVTFDFTSATFLQSVGVEAPTKDQGATSVTTMTFDGVTLTFTKVATTDNRIWNSSGALDLRMYKNSYVTITATSNVTGVSVSGAAVSFAELKDMVWTGDAASVKLTATATCKVKQIEVTYGEQPVVWKPDTISVSKAIGYIKTNDPLKNKTHYIKGVVGGTPFTVQSGGTKYCVWLTDIDNPTDSLEGFGIQKVQGTEYKDLSEMEQDFGLMDTVWVFANALSYFEKDKVYEIYGGYFAGTKGKSSTVNVTDIYKYGVGAVVIDPIKEGKYAYEVVLSSVSADDTENALHMVITPSMEKSIDGSYSLFAENSYADNGGPISGSLRLTYKSTDGANNTYHVVANYILNEKSYRIDGDYVLPGYTKDFAEPFFLENDPPYEAKEGDVLTGLQALRFAKTLGGEGKESSITVSIHGYVADKPKIEKGVQIDFDIKDNADLTGTAYAKAYYCYEQELDSILKGDEVLVTGKVQLFKGQAEISNGTITRINEGPKHYRDLPCVEIPDGYISVERAMEIGNALQAEIGKTVETDEVYTVVGYVAKVTYQMAKDTATWFLSDDKESTFGDLQAYKCHIKFMLTHGDRVMVTGKIAKYQKNATTANIEFSKGDAQIINPCTDLEQVFMKAESLHINKILVNGQLLFQKDNKWYNLQGAVIKE